MIKQTYLLICILLGLCITACQDYTDDGTIPSVVDGNMVEVTIKTGMPALTIQTRADGTQNTGNERKLGHVDILVFEVEEEGSQQTEKFAYRTKNTNDLSTIDFETSNEIEITAKLQISQNDEKYRIVFLANLKEEVESVFEVTDEETRKGQRKDKLLKDITFKQKEKWLTGEEGAPLLPMWGEAKNIVKIDKNITPGAFGGLNLLRSVARIQLGVNLNDNQSSDGSEVFEIKSVRVYNANEEAHAVPDQDPANWDDDKVNYPTLVTGTSIFETKTSGIDIKYVVQPTDENKVSGIYVTEARNKNEQTGKEENDALFLIIEAVYKDGEYAGNTNSSYYKVGFYNGEIPTDILRNVNYNMFITGVAGPGEEDEDKAKESTTSNLTVAMTEWSNGEMKYVVFNGQYYLAVSEKRFEVPKQAAQYKLDVITNYPDGWKAEITGGAPWLNGLSQDASTKIEESEEISFKAERNETQSIREDGKITFTCGNDHLSLDVLVVQSTEIEYTLLIEIDDQKNIGSFIEFDKTITFTSGVHEYYEDHEIPARTLQVRWTPKEEDLTVNFNPYFDWDDKDVTIYEDGYAEITVKPNRLTQLDEWYPEAVGDIQIHVGEETSTTQNILIRRRHHEVYVEKADAYHLDGKEHSIQLYSNTKWTIYAETAEGENLFTYFEAIEATSGEYNLENKDGLTIGFKLRDGSKIGESSEQGKSISKDLTVRIGFLDAGFDEEGKEIEIFKEYPIHVYYDNKGDANRLGEEANCYVLQASGRGVSIPVSQANRYKEEKGVYNTNPIGDNDKLYVKYIWTDHPNGLGKNNTPIKSIKMEDDNDTGPNARIIVEPGDEAGNAVIAVTNSEGKIYWSWHIWVVDERDGTKFDPYDETATWPGFRFYEFLDRNLGALSATPDDPKSMGLYYQWGRKDPFPSAADYGSSTFSTIYKEGGGSSNIYQWEFESGYSDRDNLLYSIQNPTTFISTTASTHWFGSHWQLQTPATADFWSETSSNDLASAKKGIFDPCPEGWKTVPAGDKLNTEWNNLPQLVQRSEHYSIIKGGNVDLGVWPHSGIISKNAKAITDIEHGMYWTGTDNGYLTAFKSWFMPTTAHPSEAHVKADGLSVRCMRRIGTEKE